MFHMDEIWVCDLIYILRKVFWLLLQQFEFNLTICWVTIFSFSVMAFWSFWFSYIVCWLLFFIKKCMLQICCKSVSFLAPTYLFCCHCRIWWLEIFSVACAAFNLLVTLLAFFVSLFCSEYTSRCCKVTISVISCRFFTIQYESQFWW